MAEANTALVVKADALTTALAKVGEPNASLEAKHKEAVGQVQELTRDPIDFEKTRVAIDEFKQRMIYDRIGQEERQSSMCVTFQSLAPSAYAER